MQIKLPTKHEKIYQLNQRNFVVIGFVVHFIAILWRNLCVRWLEFFAPWGGSSRFNGFAELFCFCFLLRIKFLDERKLYRRGEFFENELVDDGGVLGPSSSVSLASSVIARFGDIARLIFFVVSFHKPVTFVLLNCLKNVWINSRDRSSHFPMNSFVSSW